MKQTSRDKREVRKFPEGNVILDGATGAELDRRGVDCTLPLWSGGAFLYAP